MKKSISTYPTQANITAIMSILNEVPRQLETLSALLSPKQLRAPLAEGERSFIENVAHIINCEAITAEAIYEALLLDEPLIANIHPERQLGKLLRLELFETAELITYFKFRRMLLLRVLNGLNDAQWNRVIREEGKQRKESVYWRARTLALHELEHVTDLERKLLKTE
jgi:hypothetical protein